MSYGHLGLTNSKVVYEELEGNCVWSEDTCKLFYDGMKNRDNYPPIKSGAICQRESYL